MKFNQKYLEIALIFVIVVIGYAAYSFGYQSYVDKANKVEAQCKTVQDRINVLNEKIAKKDMFEEGIAKADSFSNIIFEKYGPGNSIEKSIMLVVDMCNTTGTTINTLNLGEQMQVFQSTAVRDGGAPKTRLYNQKLTVSINNSYTGVKRLFDYINNYPERMNVENFTLAYDKATGNLSGSMIINLYAVSDANHQYVAPVIENIELGNPNIFKSYEPAPVLLDENGMPILDENGEPVTEVAEAPAA